MAQPPVFVADSWIYGLVDPRSGALRYIGQTTMPLVDRLRAHAHSVKDAANSPLHRWLRALAPARPEIVALEAVARPDIDDAERLWIAQMRAHGVVLVNVAAGGTGRKGAGHSAEVRERIGAASRGKPLSAAHKAKIAAALKGRPVPVERRAKISATKMGYKHRPETREKIGTSNRGQKRSPETVARMAAAQRKRRAREKSGAASNLRDVA